MSYRVLYRTYRPKDFNSVVGLDAVLKVLKNQIKNNQVGHAYIFSGPRGTGKTSLAKIFAKAINCESTKGDVPCGKCSNCLAIEANTTLDIIEIDAASNNGVDEIRDLREKVKYITSSLKFKVYIIDEFHMLTTQAFNALLKTLEEPPSNIVFILATTELHKVPQTILSRCQRFTFSNLTDANVIKKLKEICIAEKIKYEEGVLELIAKISEGGLRDAISLLDQSLSFSDTSITQECILSITGGISQNTIKQLLNAIMDQNVKDIISIFENQIDSGRDINRVLSDLLIHIKDVLVEMVKTGTQSTSYMRDLAKASSRITNTIGLIKFSNQKKILAQMELINLSLSLREEVQILNGNNNKTNGIYKPTIDKDRFCKLELPVLQDLINNASIDKRIKVEEVKQLFSTSQITILRSFSKLNLLAATNNSLLLSAITVDEANYFMGLAVKNAVLKALQVEVSTLTNYYVICKKEWDILMNQILVQRSNDKNAKIMFSDIEISEYYEKDPVKETDQTKKAKALFGDKVEIKEK